MNICVTGGAGYIGSFVVHRLCEGGHRVTVVDDLSRGHLAAVDTRANFVQADCGDGAKMAGLLGGRRIDAVVHLAASALVGESIARPADYYRNNVAASLMLLEAMVEAKVPRLVFSSTAAVYGEPAAQPITEQCPTDPINPYGRTKLMVEQALADFAAAYEIEAISLRYFNVAGGLPDGSLGEDHRPETHLIPLVLAAAAGKREKVTIYGDDYPTPDGTCIRDYIHVLDLADAHVLAVEATPPAVPGSARPWAEPGPIGPRFGRMPKRGAGASATSATKAESPTAGESPACGGRLRIFNLGNGAGFSVRQVIETADRVVGESGRAGRQRIPQEVGPRRAGDPPVLVASSEKIARELGWRATRGDLEQIIGDAWAFHRSHPDGYAA